MKKNILFILLMLAGTLFAKQNYDFIVAKDGSGDFTSIQEAINAVPEMRSARTYIHIKPGIYKEKLTLPANKTNLSFIGEDALTTTLTYDDFAQKKNRFGENIGTSGSSSFFIYGDGFSATNLTFENSAGPVGQAVAVRIDGDKVSFYNCRFLGNQDTLYPHGDRSRQYYKDCYIEGTVDFIFGFSTCYFENCEIFCKKSGYITAASTPEGANYGFVFKDCKIKGTAAANSFYLGRPWRPFAQVVFLGCEIPSIIRPEGWHNWGKASNEQTAFYAEYNCTGNGSDTSLRVTWAKQLDAEQASNHSRENVLGDWNPDTH